MIGNSRKTAIVTGASGGIGYASAAALAKAGFTVFGTSRKDRGNGPAGVTMMTCDVTDDASVASLVESVLSQTGRVDVLVNNAGVGLFGGAEESSLAQVQSLFDVNLFGVMRMINAVLPSMRERGGGRLINISSALGFMPAPYSAHYAASKHALEGYSESLDHEIRAFKVRASADPTGLYPQPFRSKFSRAGFEAQGIRSGAHPGECLRQGRDAHGRHPRNGG